MKALSNLPDAQAEAVTPLGGDQAAAGASSALEDQLARIIISARNVAIVAEELLRDMSHSGVHPATAPHAVSMAPRLLAATEQQLASVAAMLRQG